MVRVLYIDDDLDDQDLIRDLIKVRRPDIDLLMAINGIEGLNHLRKIHQDGEALPKVIILDLNMPGWDGKETFKKVRAEQPFDQIPVAVLTSSANPQDKNFFVNVGDVDFYNKPSNLKSLEKLLDEILQDC